MGYLRPLLALVILLGVLGIPFAAQATETIVALGDSITAGFGLAPEESYPALLQARLQRDGFDYRVVNAGVSGDTTAGGLRRVDWVLRQQPAIVIVALGSNDGLRRLSVTAMRDNLTEIIARARAGGARVLLVGARVPPNYGADYVRDFAAVFPALARAAGVPLVSFILDGVAGIARLNQADGIHPTVEGQRIIADRLWPHLLPLLRR
jgi:acyl-CoA thioesterase-1